MDSLKGLPDGMTKEDVGQALTLLDMAEEKLGTFECLNRIKRGTFST